MKRLALLLFALSCAEPPSSPQRHARVGVSLVRDWTRDEVTAQPWGRGGTAASGDTRYCMLTGCTLVGNLIMGAGTYVRSVGVATGSLPACDATIPDATEFDTTIRRKAICDNASGSYAWRYALTSSSGTTVKTPETFQAFLATIPSPEATNYVGIFKANVGSAGGALTTQEITCQVGAGGAGVVGGAATGVVMQVIRTSDASEVCSCTLASGTAFCGAAAGSVDECPCSGTMAAGSYYVLRMKNTTDCGTNPGNLVCHLRISHQLTPGMTP